MFSYNYNLQAWIIVILIALFFAVIACAEVGQAEVARRCATPNVQFDMAFVPEDKVEEIDSAIRWVLSNYSGITNCADVEIRRVPLKDFFATMSITPWDYKIEFNEAFLALGQNDMRTVLLHEFYHVWQMENRQSNQGVSVDCLAAIDEVEATEFEIDNRYRTNMSVRMMMNTLYYLRESQGVVRRICPGE